MVLLAILNYNYWCDSEEEKKEIQKELIRNSERREQEEKELAERYNPDNIFKKRNEVKEPITDNSENMQLIKYKEQGFIKKILLKIMSFLENRGSKIWGN